MTTKSGEISLTNKIKKNNWAKENWKKPLNNIKYRKWKKCKQNVVIKKEKENKIFTFKKCSIKWTRISANQVSESNKLQKH